MKGIILAGGSGTRLYPITHVVSKQLLPIYDKPMIYYPLSVLMLAGIREILIISTPSGHSSFQTSSGRWITVGPQFFICRAIPARWYCPGIYLGADFVASDSVCLIPGDNIFYGQGFQPILLQAAKLEKGALVESPDHRKCYLQGSGSHCLDR